MSHRTLFLNKCWSCRWHMVIINWLLIYTMFHLLLLLLLLYQGQDCCWLLLTDRCLWMSRCLMWNLFPYSPQESKNLTDSIVIITDMHPVSVASRIWLLVISFQQGNKIDWEKVWIKDKELFDGPEGNQQYSSQHWCLDQHDHKVMPMCDIFS